jgi:hypothetical protein
MRTILLAPTLIAAIAAPAAAADVSGVWRLKAHVDGFRFELECKLAQTGAQVSGVCTDLATNSAEHKPQGSHALTMGEVDGDRLTFAYRTHFLLVPFTASYSGVVSGDTITGEARAPGHNGTFVATR